MVYLFVSTSFFDDGISDHINGYHDDHHHHHHIAKSTTTSFPLFSMFRKPLTQNQMESNQATNVSREAKNFGKLINSNMQKVYNVTPCWGCSFMSPWKNTAVQKSVESSMKFVNFIASFWWVHRHYVPFTTTETNPDSDPLLLWLQEAFVKAKMSSSFPGQEVFQSWDSYVNLIVNMVKTGASTRALLGDSEKEIQASSVGLQKFLSIIGARIHQADVQAGGMLPCEDNESIRNLAIGSWGCYATAYRLKPRIRKIDGDTWTDINLSETHNADHHCQNINGFL